MSDWLLITKHEGLFIVVYDIAFLLFSLFYLPVLIFKGKLHGDFAERFGVYDKDKLRALAAAGGCIWIQAVSVGEAALCRSLIPAIKERFPGRKIVLSTITKTGNDLARRLYSKDAIIIYFPLDFSYTARKAAALIRPSLYIMIETEIWPNLLKELSAAGVPSALVNGRISDRSIGKYLMVKGFLKKTFGRIGLFCMQSKLDAERIISLGAPAEKVRITGTMKFDTGMPSGVTDTKMAKDLAGLKDGEDLLVAGSTHPGEEKIVLRVYKDLAVKFPKLKLLIAPRHVERAEEIRKMISKAGFGGSGVTVIDKIGVLNNFYSIATVVYIGGSLVKHGGQNPLDAAALEKAIVFGPHMFNFKAVAALLIDGGGAIQVSDERQLSGAIGSLLNSAEKRSKLGSCAKKVVDANRGVTARNVEEIAMLTAKQ